MKPKTKTMTKAMREMQARAVTIVQRGSLTPEQRKAVTGAFTLLMWNVPGFSPGKFHTLCEAEPVAAPARLADA